MNLDLADFVWIGVITLIVAVVGFWIHIVANATSSSEADKQYQCIDGALYKDVGDMMIDTGKRCIAK